MSDDDKGFVAGAVITLLGVSMIWVMILHGTNDSWRQQIADHGCAEFYLDQNHDRQWRWKNQ